MRFLSQFKKIGSVFRTKKALGISAGVVLVILTSVIVLAVINWNADKGIGQELPDFEPYINLPKDPDPPANPTPQPPEDPPKYQGPIGLLTGLPIDEEHVNRRPIAVVVNNHYSALPQNGLLNADVIYEVLAESEITRFVAIFHSEMPLDKVGPIRSTRTYFADMALNHDAIFVIHGGTVDGYQRARNNFDALLDGMVLEPTIFWRDRNYPQWTGISSQRALEHSSYSSWQRISQHLQAQNKRDTIEPDPQLGFNFGEIPQTIRRVGNAQVVSVPFSFLYTRTFEFEPAQNRYLVSNHHGAHVDAETREQLVTNNILVQFVHSRVIDPVAGYKAVDTVGSGDGYLFTGGEQFVLRWQKASHTSPMQWFFECGTPLVLTPGKTWICVFPVESAVVTE